MRGCSPAGRRRDADVNSRTVTACCRLRSSGVTTQIHPRPRPGWSPSFYDCGGDPVLGGSMNKKLHKGDDGLTYDEDGHFVYTGLSPLSEDEDVDPDAPEDDED